jgi:catalase
MRADGNAGRAVNYEPNSFGGPVEDARFKEPPLKISGDADRYDHRQDNDDYAQAGNLFRLMTKQQERLMDNTARAMKGVPEEIGLRPVGHFHKGDPTYGEGVARRMGVDLAQAVAA